MTSRVEILGLRAVEVPQVARPCVQDTTARGASFTLHCEFTCAGAARHRAFVPDS